MSIFRFEHRSKPVASRAVFAGRLIYNLVFALFIVAIALAAGMVGYRITEQMRWLDSFLNAAMLLGGMGPVDVLKSDAGKLFALPEGVDFETGASLLMTYGTTIHGLLDRGHLKAGETLLVLGAAGGVGLAGIELGKAFGARTKHVRTSVADAFTALPPALPDAPPPGVLPAAPPADPPAPDPPWPPIWPEAPMVAVVSRCMFT